MFSTLNTEACPIMYHSTRDLYAPIAPPMPVTHFRNDFVIQEMPLTIPAPNYYPRTPNVSKDVLIQSGNTDAHTLMTDDFLGDNTLDAWSQRASTRQNQTGSRHYGEPGEVWDQTHSGDCDVLDGSHLVTKLEAPGQNLTGTLQTSNHLYSLNDMSANSSSSSSSDSSVD